VSFFFSSFSWEGGKEKDGRRGKRMEVTVHDSVEPQDPREWIAEKVTTFVRSLGPAECFQSDGDQVLHVGEDDRC
jgi:hypothetical protein